MKKLFFLIMLLPITLFAQTKVDISKLDIKLNSEDSIRLQKQLEIKIFRQLEIEARYNKLTSYPKIKSTPQKTKKKYSRRDILKAIFLGCQFPWETDEQYKLRKEVERLPACQPFK